MEDGTKYVVYLFALRYVDVELLDAAHFLFHVLPLLVLREILFLLLPLHLQSHDCHVTATIGYYIT